MARDLGQRVGLLEALGPGERYVSVEITIHNATDGEVAWDPLLLRIELSDGSELDFRTFDGGFGNLHLSRDWHGGESHTATFYVKLPASVDHYVIAVGRQGTHRASVQL